MALAQSQIVVRRPLLTQRRRQTIAGIIFVLPSLALFVAFLAAPLLYSLYISFNKWSMMRDPIS